MALWTIALVLMWVITFFSLFIHPALFMFFGAGSFFATILSIRIIYEYQRGIVFTLGRYTALLQPGLRIIIPIVQRVSMVDLRLDVVEVPEQSPITRDNVSITVDAVIYYRVIKDQAQNSVIKVEDFAYAISQLAQTTMRNIIGEMSLDEILSNRDEASKKIQLIVDKASDPWGIKVEAVELKRIELPESMKTIMAKAAEAERIKRAVIIKSLGEAQAAKIVAEAAEVIGSVEGGLNLRTLQGIGNIASDPSNEIVFFVPLDVIRPLEGYKGAKK